MEDHVRLLGVRGSVPVSGEAFARYGGATLCVLVQLAGRTVLLDAGTGLLRLPDDALTARELPLLLSHAHIDHLLGLPLSACVLRRDTPQLEVYAKGADEPVKRLMSPPLWPVGPASLPAPPCFRELPASLALGPVRVTTMEGVHPGGVTLFRLEGGGKSVVYAADCALTDELAPALTAFARDCDLLLCDGQYSDEEWPAKSAFGHSRWTAAAALGRACGAKRVRIIHHDPARTDEELDAAAPALAALCPGCAFGHEGEVIAL